MRPEFVAVCNTVTTCIVYTEKCGLIHPVATACGQSRKIGMNEFINLNFEDGVARIGVMRPQKKNALTQAMYAALADALDAAESDASINAILLHGTDEVFSAGNDMQDFLTNFSLDESAPVVRFLHTLAAAAKPVVAAVK